MRAYKEVDEKRKIKMTNKEINHSGYICLKRENKHFAYDFKDGIVTIHMYEGIPELDNENVMLGRSFDNKQYAFGSQLPLEIGENHLFPINYNFQADWVIQNFRAGSKFHQAIFTFAELQYFCPSRDIAEIQSDDSILFKGSPVVKKEFNLTLFGKECKTFFIVAANGTMGYANTSMQTESKLCIEFEATGEVKFLEKLYEVVDSAFAFICNRRNTDCVCMELKGEYPDKRRNEKKVVDCTNSISSTMYFYNKYRESPEPNKIISKTFYVSAFLKHIDGLFALIAKDAESENTFEAAAISIASIHPSAKRRRLIDLQQSLQITGAFEFYVRKYLPCMIEEKTHHTILKMVLDEFSRNKSVNKNARKLAKNMAKSVLREPALEEKIIKAYTGYSEWKPLKACFKEEWFNLHDVKEIAHEANIWRNELAHTKRSYVPSMKTIQAVRLMEHMNYAIVLRMIGYEDEEICGLLEKVLEQF